MDPTSITDSTDMSSVPLFDPSRLPLRQWCTGSREDVITGLVGFPDFHAALPRSLAATLESGGLVALAIGDVDGLKEHVESANDTDPNCYGHLAGNRVMAQLGEISRTWFHEQTWTAGVTATFGGDEIIVAAAITDAADFHCAISHLRNRLGKQLPVPVSFALTVIGPGHLPDQRSGSRWKHSFVDTLLASTDRCLFAHKRLRRASHGQGGIIAVNDFPAPGPPVTGALLPLPTGTETLHVQARQTMLPSGPALLLPCRGPEGLRGQRMRVTSQNVRRARVVVSVAGQAAIPGQGCADDGIALQLEPIRPGRPHRVPDDLSHALATAGARWQELPDHERAQMLHLITESATPAIRNQRIAAAVSAATHRSPA